jgi:hypothetical protein
MWDARGECKLTTDRSFGFRGALEGTRGPRSAPIVSRSASVGGGVSAAARTAVRPGWKPFVRIARAWAGGWPPPPGMAVSSVPHAEQSANAIGSSALRASAQVPGRAEGNFRHAKTQRRQGEKAGGRWGKPGPGRVPLLSPLPRFAAAGVLLASPAVRQETAGSRTRAHAHAHALALPLCVLASWREVLPFCPSRRLGGRALSATG